MNKKEFAAAMKKYGDIQDTLAKALGISRTRLNFKINGTNGATFTQVEIKTIKERYSLTPEMLEKIFFAN